MRFSNYQSTGRRHQNGQIMLLFVLFIVVLILMVGLGVDLGFVYTTKAELSKAVDAACLAGLAHLSEGDAAASTMAKSTFRANYGVRPGRDTASIVPTVTFRTTASGNQTVIVKATTTVNTFFVRVLPNWKTMTVTDEAQAIRANAIITLVLDRSSSMAPSCFGAGCSQGGTYLPSAVRNFINRFDDNVDQAALVSFSSTAITNIAMGRPFKNAITTAANNLPWAGYTFAHGGLTNALAINNGVTVPAGQNALKVIVFFTDGLANMIQNTLPTSGAGFPCSAGTAQAWNFAGFNNDVLFFRPNAAIPGGQLNSICTTPPGTPACCGSPNQFRSIDTNLKYFTMNNVVLDATNRCVQVANQARAAGMVVYAIGLDGDGIGPAQKAFLNLVANDRESPVYDSNLPVGIAFNLGDGSDLEGAFQQVAADILLRLIE